MPTVDCPTCGRKLRVADDLGEATVQCPRCSTTFNGPAAEVEVASAPAEPIEPLGPPPPPGLPPPPKPLRPVLLSSTTEPAPSASRPDDEWQTCPVCRNRETVGISRCTICGTELVEEPHAAPRLPPRRDYESDRGSVISTLGTLSVLFALPGLCGALFWPFTLASAIGAVLGGSALVMAGTDLDLMERNIMDPQGRESTLSGKGQAAIGLTLGLVGLFLGGVVKAVDFIGHL